MQIHLLRERDVYSTSFLSIHPISHNTYSSPLTFQFTSNHYSTAKTPGHLRVSTSTPCEPTPSMSNALTQGWERDLSVMCCDCIDPDSFIAVVSKWGFLSLSLSLSLSVFCLFVSVCVCLSVCMSVWLTDLLTDYIWAYQSICLVLSSVCALFFLYVYVSVLLNVSVWFFLYACLYVID